MVVTIVVIVGIIGIGVGILAYRNRTEKGIESGITSFRRELHALAPRPGEERSAPGRPTPDARGVTIMSDQEDEPEPETEAAEAAEAAEDPEPDVPEPEVTVESTPDVGATFTIRMPAAADVVADDDVASDAPAGNSDAASEDD